MVDEWGAEGRGLDEGLPAVDGPGERIPLGVSRDDDALLLGREKFFCAVFKKKVEMLCLQLSLTSFY